MHDPGFLRREFSRGLYMEPFCEDASMYCDATSNGSSSSSGKCSTTAGCWGTPKMLSWLAQFSAEVWFSKGPGNMPSYQGRPVGNVREI
jgi:hypothetical protein